VRGTENDLHNDTQTEHDQNPQGGGESNGGDDSNSQIEYKPSGLWDMFLADTTAQLAYAPDAGDLYVWWEVTLVFPTYIHYEAVGSQSDIQEDEDGTMDLTGYNNDLNTNSIQSSENHASPSSNNDNKSKASSMNGSTQNQIAYWVPVQDEGTLRYLSRILENELKTAISSGTLLSNLQELSIKDDPKDLVSFILGLAIPGSEYPISPDDVLSLLEGSEDIPPESNSTSVPYDADGDNGDDDDGENKPPWMRGTYTGSLLSSRGTSASQSSRDDWQERLGFLVLLLTFLGVACMMTMAWLRQQSQRRALREYEKGNNLEAMTPLQLGTDQDVAEILRLGWRQYSLPPAAAAAKAKDTKEASSCASVQSEGCSGIGGRPVVPNAEIIEVFDKGRAGYNEDDSMLHGSAMNQSVASESVQDIMHPSLVDMDWKDRGDIFSSLHQNVHGRKASWRRDFHA